MKQPLLFCLVLFMSLGFIKAQPVITNEVFPQIGDSISYAIDNSPENIQLTASGEAQVWDYSSLKSDFFVQQIFETPDSGVGFSLFPEATLLSRIAQNVESYWRVTDNQIELLGAYGEDPIGLGVIFSSPFVPPLVEISTPLNYLDTLEYSSSFVVPFATENLPDTIVAMLPIAPDSFRIRTNIQRLDIVDAWGSLQLPEETFEVLRQKRLEIANIRVDAKIIFLGWQDVTEAIIPLLMGSQLQSDSLLTYRFLSNEAKEPVLICSMDSTGQSIASAQFKSRLIPTDVEEEVSPVAHLSVFPNPASDFIQIDIREVPTGQYSLQLFHYNGQMIHQERFWMSGHTTQRLSVNGLEPGFYIGILKNVDTGKTMSRPFLLIKQ